MDPKAKNYNPKAWIDCNSTATMLGTLRRVNQVTTGEQMMARKKASKKGMMRDWAAFTPAITTTAAADIKRNLVALNRSIRRSIP